MRKNKLVTAMAAAVVGVAGMANLSNAVNVNPDGSGQVLLYPYYTVEAGNDTLISVVNTTNEVKAVKVRFLEQQNSRDVLDFHLYLSPFDVWTAAVRTNPAGDVRDGFPILTTSDTSCTVPDIRTNPLLQQLPNGQRFVEFSPLQMGGRPPADARAGYIEVIEMGVVSNVVNPTFLPASWATHGANGVPASCASLVSAWSNGGVWAGQNGQPLAAPLNLLGQTGVGAPTGGLFGGGSIINVEQGRMISYNAKALSGFLINGTGNLHNPPANIFPNLNSIANANPVQFAQVFANGQLFTSEYRIGADIFADGQRIDAVSATMMTDRVVNEFAFGLGGTFQSEWVVTFPTKRFYTDVAVNGEPAAFRPFSRHSSNAPGANTLCEEVAFTIRDREEFRVPQVFFSPNLPPSLCSEASVVNFEEMPAGSGFVLPPLAATPVLGARTGPRHALRVGIAGGVNAGWAEMSMVTANNAARRQLRTSVDGDVYSGLPAIGFWVLGVTNNDVGSGIRAFYSGAFDHRYNKTCQNNRTNPPSTCAGL